jgi:hypothetical protein
MLDLNQVGSTSRCNVVLENEASAVTLPRGEVYFGRSVACFLRIEDPGISRMHFRITVGEGGAVIEDLGSTNGTQVNGERLRGPRSLGDGDMITVGNRVFRVGFVDTTGVAFDDGEVTPFPQEQTRGTLPGVGCVPSQVELGERCPSCQARVGVRADFCPACGYRWPRAAASRATTEPEAPAVYCRRRHRRHTLTHRARYTGVALEVEGEIHNLSESGLFLATSQVETVGARCTIVVADSDGARVTLPGFVRHVIHHGVNKTSGMGVEFTNLSPEAEQWVARQLVGRD